MEREGAFGGEMFSRFGLVGLVSNMPLVAKMRLWCIVSLHYTGLSYQNEDANSGRQAGRKGSIPLRGNATNAVELFSSLDYAQRIAYMCIYNHSGTCTTRHVRVYAVNTKRPAHTCT